MQALAFISRGIKPLLLAIVLIAGQSLAAYGAMPCCPENASPNGTQHTEAHEHGTGQAAHSHEEAEADQTGHIDTCNTICCGTCMPFADFAFASIVKSQPFGPTANITNDEQFTEPGTEWLTPPPKN